MREVKIADDVFEEVDEGDIVLVRYSARHGGMVDYPGAVHSINEVGIRIDGNRPHRADMIDVTDEAQVFSSESHRLIGDVVGFYYTISSGLVGEDNQVTER